MIEYYKTTLGKYNWFRDDFHWEFSFYVYFKRHRSAWLAQFRFVIQVSMFDPQRYLILDIESNGHLISLIKKSSGISRRHLRRNLKLLVSRLGGQSDEIWQKVSFYNLKVKGTLSFLLLYIYMKQFRCNNI